MMFFHFVRSWTQTVQFLIFSWRTSCIILYGHYAVCTIRCTFRCCSRLNVLLYTSQGYKFPQYVHADVPSRYFYHWIFYCTHCSNLDASQYILVDVSSGYLHCWMFYCTHHSNMDAPHYVHTEVFQTTCAPEHFIAHITEIWTFHSMYTQMYIHATSITVCCEVRMELISVITSLAVNITSMKNAYCHVYSCDTPDDGQLIGPKHVEFFIKINLRNSASCWHLLYEYITMHGPLNVKIELKYYR